MKCWFGNCGLLTIIRLVVHSQTKWTYHHNRSILARREKKGCKQVKKCSIHKNRNSRGGKRKENKLDRMVLVVSKISWNDIPQRNPSCRNICRISRILCHPIHIWLVFLQCSTSNKLLCKTACWKIIVDLVCWLCACINDDLFHLTIWH